MGIGISEAEHIEIALDLMFHPKYRIPLSFILPKLDPLAIRSSPRAATISLIWLSTASVSLNCNA